MKNIVKFIAAGLLFGGSVVAQAFEEPQFYGTWCLYEKEQAGNIESAQVNVIFNTDGSYKWVDTLKQESGTWSVNENSLVLSEAGDHTLVSVSSHRIVMTGDVTMKMRKDSCF